MLYSFCYKEACNSYKETTAIKPALLHWMTMPVQLQEKGLSDALQQMMENITVMGSVQLHYSNTLPPVPMERKIHIYRLIQEITNNVIKHAAAELLTVTLQGDNKKLLLRVGDNGKGFDKNNILRSGKGTGLIHIRRRVDMLGGKLYLDTAPGKGTSYLIEIPNNA